MVLLVFVSLITLISTFTIVLVMIRRPAAEKSMDVRIAMIRAPSGDTTESSSAMPLLLKPAKDNRVGWLGNALQKYKILQTLQLRIKQANSSMTVSRLILASLGLAIIGYVVTWLFVPLALIDVPCAIALGFLPHWILSFRRSRRIAAFNAVLADTIDMLARALRAGYSMVGAIGMVADNAQQPAASEFGEIFKQQNLGMPLRDALLQLLDRFPSLDLRVLVTAILVQKDTGGNLAEILDRTVFVIRERLRIQGEIRVQTAQGRMTGWILSALPVVMLVLINLVNPGYSSILLSDPTGRKLVYFSVAMLAVGAFVIHRVVNGIEV